MTREKRMKVYVYPDGWDGSLVSMGYEDEREVITI